MSLPSSEDLLDRVRDLLTQGEIGLALEQLKGSIPALGHRDLTREVLLHAGRYVALRRQARQGTLTSEQVRAEENTLTRSLLEFLDEVPRKTERRQWLIPTAAVSFQPPDEVRLEKLIFGVSHIKRISWLQQGLEAARSVCRVVGPRGKGTGFLVEHGQRTWLLTNHHVLPDGAAAAEACLEFNYEEDPRGNLLPFHSYSLKGETARADATLDYCFVEVAEKAGQPPVASWGRLVLDTGPPPSRGDHVTIIQHPEGGPKQIAVTANWVVNVFGHCLQYTTDTLPGSSGSPVFNDSWRVIALHHAGGNLVGNSRGDRMFANEGILIGDILRHAQL